MENSLVSNKFIMCSTKGSTCMQSLAEILSPVQSVEKYLTQKTEG